MDNLFECSPVFEANLRSSKRIKVNQGGTSSTKTYSIIQLLYYKAITQPETFITIVGESIPILKKGAYRDAEVIYGNTPLLKYFVKDWNKTNRIISFTNGSLMEFTSYTSEQDARAGKRQILFINEANGISYQIYFQLELRTIGKKTKSGFVNPEVYIDYNPSAKFWAHEEVIGTEDAELIISDHRHNLWLSDAEHKKIESIKDPELWKVYARGMTGNVTGIIYPNWKRMPDKDFYNITKDMPYIFGVDFGYNDPAAIMKVYYSGDQRYVEELAYSPDLDPTEMTQILKQHGYNDSTVAYCDHNNKKAIAIMRRLGITHAMLAQKGKFSVNMGIQHIKKSYKVFYNESSLNLHKELQRYVWLKDKNTGKETNTPIDDWNHALDAPRYAIFSHAAPMM